MSDNKFQEISDWDKQAIARLNEIIKLKNEGKLEELPIEQVFNEAKDVVCKAQKKQKSEI